MTENQPLTHQITVGATPVLSELSDMKDYSHKTLEELYRKYTKLFDKIVRGEGCDEDCEERYAERTANIGVTVVTLTNHTDTWGGTLTGYGATTDYRRDLVLETVVDGIAHGLEFLELQSQGRKSVRVRATVGKEGEKIDLATGLGQLVGVLTVPVEVKGSVEREVYPDPEGIRGGGRIMGLGVNILRAVRAAG